MLKGRTERKTLSVRSFLFKNNYLYFIFHHKKHICYYIDQLRCVLYPAAHYSIR